MVKKENYENVCISVIDNEIKQHINKRIEESKMCLKKYCKWIYNILDDSKINENLNKDLIDYEKFKLDCKTINIDLKNINPEIIMKKYFEVQYPFEISKPDEFKDAFFLEVIYQYAKNHDSYTSFAVITNDKGIKKAIDKQPNKKIIYFDSIEALIDTLIKYPEKDKTDVYNFIQKYDFSNQIEKMIKIDILDLEEENIDINNYECSAIYFPKIIKTTKERILLVCDMLIWLNGDFSCLDYDNSYYSIEEGDYLYKQYIEKEYLGFICQTDVEVTKKNGKYTDAKIIELPEIEISYKSINEIENNFGI